MLQQYRIDHGITWTMASDTAGVRTAYGVWAVPWTFIIDSQGVIRKDYLGLASSKKFIAELEKWTPPLPPVASFVWWPDPRTGGQPINFDASGSSDSDGTIVSYAWDFGDGTTGTGVKPLHTYTLAGDYTVTLTVTDDDGSTNTTARTIAASPPPIGVPVYLDIKPGSWPNPLNLNSQGVLPIAICGTEDFDVRTINATTIKLSLSGVTVGVSPLECEYKDSATPWMGEPGGGHDLGRDGNLDLLIVFPTQELRTVLGLDAFENKEISLVISGNLNDAAGGTPITGQDYVWLFAPRLLQSRRR